MALAKVAASIWEATLNKVRQGYVTVIRPATTYEAPVRHPPKDIREKALGPAAKFITLQNKSLRSMIGAYKATDIEVSEQTQE